MELSLFAAGAAGCCATVLHDGVMNPADGKLKHESMMVKEVKF